MSIISNGDIVKVQCDGCHRILFVKKEFVRDKMYCTIQCMDKEENKEF